jgi:hypothetical protein
VQRIPEEDEARDRQLPIGCCHLGRYPPAHRLAADEEKPSGRCDVCAHDLDYVQIAALELWPAVRNAPLRRDVWGIECDDVEAVRRQSPRECHDERTPLAGTGAVRQDERRLGTVSREVDEPLT